jgi:foldase protein PrsA
MAESDSGDKEIAAKEIAAKEIAAKERASKESVSKESVSKESAGKESASAGKESAGSASKESASKESAGKESAGKEGRLLSIGSSVRLTRRGILVGGVALAVALGGSGILLTWTSGSPGSTPESTRWAAKVNGEVILVSQVSEALKRFEATDQFDQLAEETDPATAHREFERMYLTQQINRLVLRSRAEELGIDIENEVAQRLEEMRSGYESEEQFRQTLKGSGYTLAEFSRAIEDQVLQEKLREEATASVGTESEPSEQELREYYDSHSDDYRQTRVQHILVKEEPVARDISDRLRSAAPEAVDALLAKLAREHSIDESSATNGGSLGWVTAGELVLPFASALDELEVGEVSLPVSTDFGFHVIRINGRRVQPFETVRDEVAQQLGEVAEGEAWVQWLLDSYGQVQIELISRYGEFNAETGQIVESSAAEPSD